MVTVFAGTLIVFLLSIAALAAGIMLGGEPIKGSCGGIACVKAVKCQGCPHGGERR